MGERCCNDVAVHSHDGGVTLRRAGREYSYRHAFSFRRPRVHGYRAATVRPVAVRLNRYPGVIIGIAVQVGTRVLSLVWGAPGRIVETPRV
jgi:hypothetical protein